MKLAKIKLNAKNIDATVEFITNKFGKVDSVVELNPLNFPFKVFIQNPTDEKPYYTLITLGVQLIKNKMNLKKLEGWEFFMRLPPNWIVPDEPSDESAWPFFILESFVSIMLKNSPIIPALTTLEFKELGKNSKQNIAIADFPSCFGEDYPILTIKKKDIAYLEIQTLYREEFLHNQSNHDILEYIYQLPYIDLNRKNFIVNNKEE